MGDIARFHPFPLFCWFAAVISVSVFVPNPVIGVTSLLGGGCLLFVCRRGRLRARTALSYVLLFALVTLTNPVFSHGGKTPLFFVNGTPVTLESAAYGAGLAVGIVSVLLLCACWSEVMSDEKFMYLFGRAAPKLSVILSAAQRMIPRFLRRMRTVNGAVSALGARTSQSFSDRAAQSMKVFYAMTAWSAENSIETASAMKARGYGLCGRTSFSPVRFRAKDGVLLALTLALTAVTFTGVGTGALGFEYYPEITGIPSSPLALAVYVSFGVLSFLPCFFRVGGVLKWKYCVSRI